ncbi:MAG: hypothetical protein ACYCVN_07565 [Acidimicrobiales bacterium]
MTDDLYGMVEPVVSALELELVDVEQRSGVVLVTVDRPGGVDLESLVRADRAVTAAFDEVGLFERRYTLEVSSPGVERMLRRPEHFTRAVGAMISVKTRPQVPGERRLRGTLVEADDDGFELSSGQDGAGRVRLAYSDVDRVRTVFEWGPGPRPGERGKVSSGRTGHDGDVRTGGSTDQAERKQVATS